MPPAVEDIEHSVEDIEHPVDRSETALSEVNGVILWIGNVSVHAQNHHVEISWLGLGYHFAFGNRLCDSDGCRCNHHGPGSLLRGSRTVRRLRRGGRLRCAVVTEEDWTVGE